MAGNPSDRLPVRKVQTMSITFTLDNHPELAVNLANANARAMLDLMNVPAECAGQILPEHLDSVIRRLMRAVNDPGARHFATVDDWTVGNFIEFGRDDEYVRRTAARLLAIAVEARRSGLAISWD